MYRKRRGYLVNINIDKSEADESFSKIIPEPELDDNGSDIIEIYRKMGLGSEQDRIAYLNSLNPFHEEQEQHYLIRTTANAEAVQLETH